MASSLSPKAAEQDNSKLAPFGYFDGMLRLGRVEYARSHAEWETYNSVYIGVRFTCTCRVIQFPG